MYMKSLEAQLMVYETWRISKALLLYVPPVLLILGTIGNVLSFIILTRKSMRVVSSYTYLAVLSITDTLVLYVGLLRLWVGELMEYDIRDQSDWICKFINVLGYTVSDYSVWLIVAVTVERFIAVCHALRAPAMCNRSRAARVIIAVGFIILAINFHFFFTVQIRVTPVEDTQKVIYQCNAAEGFDKLFNVWHFVDAFIYSFLPFVILSVLNGLIIHKVWLAKRSRHVLSEHRVQHRGGSSPNHAASPRHHESSARLTVMLLTISFAFVLTTLPVNITLLMNVYWAAISEDLSGEEQYRLLAKASLLRTITELLMYTNHSMNFFLYCATGQKFRHQLCQLFCRRESSSHAHYSQKMTATTAVTTTNNLVTKCGHGKPDANGQYIPVASGSEVNEGDSSSLENWRGP